ncbi:hypothetical protein H0H92_005054, partial [Tricholoma furcatifolium]
QDDDIMRIDEGAEGYVFDPDVTTKRSLSEGFRAFIQKEEIEEPPHPLPHRSQLDKNEQEIRVYTDGSCLNNGSTVARAGAGVWFGQDDKQNRAIRLPTHMENSNNSAEAIAIFEAVINTDPDLPLKILTDSKLTLKELTKLLSKHEDEGWTTTANKSIIKTTVEALRKRGGPTILQKVKGHAGIEGNEGADSLADDGAKTLQATPSPCYLREDVPYSKTTFGRGASMVAAKFPGRGQKSLDAAKFCLGRGQSSPPLYRGRVQMHVDATI